jgi:thiosulfate reductase/polysulfide reductase chain A
MHVRCQSSRVVKCEGNPNHPVSRGGLCPRGQSVPQGLCDPDRLRKPLQAGRRDFEPLSWLQAIDEVAGALKEARRLIVVRFLSTVAFGAD